MFCVSMELQCGIGKKSFFSNAAFQHFKPMYGPFSFEGMIAVKLIKRVVSKAVPELFGEPLLKAHLLFPSAAR